MSDTDQGREQSSAFEIAQAIPSLVFIHSSEGRNRFVNEAFCEFAGRPPQGLLEDRWLDLVDPRDLESAGLAWQRAVAESLPFVAEYRMRRHDGAWRWLLVRSVPQRLADGTIGEWIGTATDITEHKEAARALQLSLEASDTGLWTWDVRTNVVTWSAETYRILGVVEGEFDGTAIGFFRLVHPHDVARVESVVRDALGSRALYESEFRIVRPDGEVVWVANRGRATYDAAGNALTILGTITDVTARKRTEEVARRSEKLYRAMATHMPNAAAFVVDRALRYRLADGEALRALGLTPADLEGKRVGETLPDLLAEEREAQYRGALAGVPFTLEHEHGEHVFITHGVPLPDDDGDIEAVLAISYDITGLRRAERERLESEERFRTMADGTPITIWVADALGQVEFVNRSYCELFGTTLERVRNEGWQPLVHPEDEATYVQAFLEALRERRPFRAETRARRADGSWRWLTSFGAPRFGPAGEFVGMVGSSLDITDRKHAEEELRRALRHNELFMGVLGHDLRNPLGSMLMSAHALLSMVHEPGARKAIERISRGGRRMERMIAQLLDVTRIRSAGGLDAHRTSVDLRALVGAVVDELRAAQPGAVVEVRVSGNVCGWWDPDRLAQLVSNLVGNAIQHASGSREVEVEIDGSQPESVTLRVHNEGAIPPDLLDVLFEPFKRSPSGAGTTGSLGLGLYISREIARSHGGDVHVVSSGERRTTFEVVLPHGVESSVR